MIDPKPYFFTLSLMTAKTCSGSLVVFGSSGWKVSNVTPKTEIININYYFGIKNACHVKTKKTCNARQCTGQREVEERTGIRPCIWQIEVVHKVLKGVDVMMIAATGSGKSLCYWMALLYVKYGIVSN
jgi:hypothetical protein